MPSRYEEQALQEIHAWKEPATGWFAETLQLLNIPLDAAGNLLNKTPGVGWVMHKSVGGLVSVANDVAQWSVRPEAIFKEYQDTGSAVTSHPAADLDPHYPEEQEDLPSEDAPPDPG